MNWKKLLGILLGIFILTLAVTFLINAFYPNWVTVAAIKLLTVTGPAYVTSKIEWVVGSISAILGTVAVAKNTINNTKKQATAQVSDAQQLTQLAYTENQKLITETIPTKDAQITELTAQNNALSTSSSEAVNRYAVIEAENLRLKTQLETLKDQQALATAYATDPRVIEAKTSVVA